MHNISMMTTRYYFPHQGIMFFLNLHPTIHNIQIYLLNMLTFFVIMFNYIDLIFMSSHTNLSLDTNQLRSYKEWYYSLFQLNLFFKVFFNAIHFIIEASCINYLCIFLFHGPYHSIVIWAKPCQVTFDNMRYVLNNC